jgi:hypothetical protein
MISAADLLQGYGFPHKLAGGTQTDATYLHVICIVEIITRPSSAIERAVEKDCQPMVRHV